MEHACLQCDASVEDAAPFCSSCGAAQIRFSAPEQARALVAVVPSLGAEQSLPAKGYRVQGFPADDSRATIRAALYAGVIGAVLSSIPVVPNFILALPVAGFLSVLFFRRWTHGPEPRPSVGFKLGALAGLFAFLAFLIFTAIGTLTFHVEGELRQAMVEAVRLQQARATDPQVRQMLDYFMTPQGMMLMMGFGFLLMGITFVLLAGTGAALSASLLRRKAPPER